MPFETSRYTIDQPTKAFLFMMQQFNLTQAQAQREIAKQRIFQDGRVILKSSELISGEVIVSRFVPRGGKIDCLYQDEDLLLFDKPSSLLVHPNKKDSPYTLLDEIRFRGGDNSNAVHRIDFETSGLVLATKNSKAEHQIKQSFEKREISKSYLAWVKGKIEKSFEVDEPLRVCDDYSQSKHKVIVSAEGKKSLTSFSPLCYSKKFNATLLQCYPHTGRTHQIRVHLFHVKHPIVGDPLYGTNYDFSNRYLDKVATIDERIKHSGASRLLLHAQTLSFSYKEKRYHFESKTDFENLIETTTIG